MQSLKMDTHQENKFCTVTETHRDTRVSLQQSMEMVKVIYDELKRVARLGRCTLWSTLTFQR